MKSAYVNAKCDACALPLVQLLAWSPGEIETVTCPRCSAALPALSVTAVPLAGAVQAVRGCYKLREKKGGKKP